LIESWLLLGERRERSKQQEAGRLWTNAEQRSFTSWRAEQVITRLQLLAVFQYSVPLARTERFKRSFVF